MNEPIAPGNVFRFLFYGYNVQCDLHDIMLEQGRKLMMNQSMWTLWGLVLLMLLAACGDESSGAAGPTAVPNNPTSTPLVATAVAVETPPTATPIPPSPTPSEPLAALVNEQPISLADFEKELARHEQAQTALGLPPDDPAYPQVVLATLIERALITQMADVLGILITSDQVEAELARYQTTSNGEGNFEAWLDANQYTLDEFREALAEEMLVAQVRDEVVADVPFAVEQVHARYIQVDDAELAAAIRQQLADGADFAALAERYSLDRKTAVNGGDLGFFPEWGLLVPEIAAAAFALPENEVSQIVAVPDASAGQMTYYLVQLLERDEKRPLSPGMRYLLLDQTFQEWLQMQAEQANIIRFVNTES